MEMGPWGQKCDKGALHLHKMQSILPLTNPKEIESQQIQDKV